MNYETLFQNYTFSLLVVSTTLLVNKFVLKNVTISQILLFMFSYLIVIPTVPPLAALCFVSVLWRWMIWLCFKIFYPGKRFLATVSDSIFFVEKYASSSVSVGVIVTEGECNRDRIRNTLIKAAKSDMIGGKMYLKCRPFLGFSCWEKTDKFNIDDHVIFVEDTTFQKPMNETQLFEYMSGFQDKVITNKSPWEFIIIPNFAYNSTVLKDRKNLYVAIFRFHHSIMDGVSTANFLHSALADKPFKFYMDPSDTKMKTSKLVKYLTYLKAAILIPQTVVQLGFHVDNKQNKFFQPDAQLTGPKAFTWSRPISLDTMKKLKNRTKTSVLSIELSCLGAAYGKSYYKGKVPESKIFHSLAPAAILPYPDRGPQNRLGGSSYPINIGKAFTPQQRLQSVHQSSKDSAKNSIIIGTYLLLQLKGLLPLILQRKLIPLIFTKMSLTNIPGPCEPILMFSGDPVLDLGAWITLRYSFGMGMGVFSYSGRMRASIIADKVAKIDINVVKEEFENQLVLLAESVGIEGKELFLED